MRLRLLALLCALWAAAPAAALAQQTVRFATAYADGASAPIAAGLVEIANASGSGLNWTFERAPNSADALARLAGGDADLVLVNGYRVHQLHAGAAEYEGVARRDLRGVAALFPFALHVLVRRDLAPHGDLGDMRNVLGLFNIGRRGYDAYHAAAGLFRALDLAPVGGGLTFDPEPEAVEALARGDVAGMVTGGTVPAAAADRALRQMDGGALALLGLDATARERLESRMPGVWYPLTVGPETYPALPRQVDLPAVSLMIATRADVQEQAVRVILQALFGDKTMLRMIHPAADSITLDSALRGLPVPLHGAAAGYFAAAGVRIPERLRP